MKFGFDERTVLAPQMAQLSLQGQRRPSARKAKGRRLALALFDGHRLFWPKKAAALCVVMRKRPAFRSTFARHALNGGCGIVLTGRRHKALLGKARGDLAKRAAVIQLGRRLDHFRA